MEIYILKNMQQKNKAVFPQSWKTAGLFGFQLLPSGHGPGWSLYFIQWLLPNSNVLGLVLDQSQRTHAPIKTPERSEDGKTTCRGRAAFSGNVVVPSEDPP